MFIFYLVNEGIKLDAFATPRATGSWARETDVTESTDNFLLDGVRASRTQILPVDHVFHRPLSSLKFQGVGQKTLTAWQGSVDTSVKYWEILTRIHSMKNRTPLTSGLQYTFINMFGRLSKPFNRKIKDTYELLERLCSCLCQLPVLLICPEN